MVPVSEEILLRYGLHRLIDTCFALLECVSKFKGFSLNVYKSKMLSGRGAQISGGQATECLIVVPIICGSSEWYFLLVTLLAPRILIWRLDFWKMCALLVYSTRYIGYNCGLLCYYTAYSCKRLPTFQINGLTSGFRVRDP
jgi:hypothetical protein